MSFERDRLLTVVLAAVTAATLLISAATAAALHWLGAGHTVVVATQGAGGTGATTQNGAGSTTGGTQGTQGGGGGAQAAPQQGTLANQGVSGNVIKVCSIITQTGPGRSITMAHAVVAWERAVNAAGGIDGYRVDVDLKDDQGNPDLGASQYRQCNEDEKVFAFLSECAPITDAQMVPYMNQAAVPILGECQSAPSAYNSPYLWVAGPTPYQNGIMGATLTERTRGWPASGHQIALVCLNDPSTTPVCNGAAARYGSGALWNGGPQTENITDNNYSQLIAQWQSDGVGYVHLVLDPASVERYLYSAQTAGWSPPTMNNLVIDNGIGSQFANAEGMLIGSPWTPLDAGTAGMQRFRSTLAHYFPDDHPDLYAETGWMGCLLLEHAIQLMGSNVTRQNLVDVLNNGFRNWDTGMGPVENYSSSNHTGPLESALLGLQGAGSEDWRLVTVHGAISG